MEDKIDVLSTLVRKAQLPDRLQNISEEYIHKELKDLYQNIATETPGIVLLTGLRRGKTTNAAALMLAYLESRRYIMNTENIARYISVSQMCYQNRSVDRFKRDESLQAAIREACLSDFLILDGVFSCLTQNDELLLNAIYDARQHKSGWTVVTTTMSDPFRCAGSVLYRIARDATYFVDFGDGKEENSSAD